MMTEYTVFGELYFLQEEVTLQRPVCKTLAAPAKDIEALFCSQSFSYRRASVSQLRIFGS